MRLAYIDSSCLVAIALEEPGAAEHHELQLGFDVVFSSGLLEAELRSALAREECAYDEKLLAGIEWVLPRRSLASELSLALAAGYLRGADLWHVACALYLRASTGALTFLTADVAQRRVAASLGLD